MHLLCTPTYGFNLTQKKNEIGKQKPKKKNITAKLRFCVICPLLPFLQQFSPGLSLNNNNYNNHIKYTYKTEELHL